MKIRLIFILAFLGILMSCNNYKEQNPINIKKDSTIKSRRTSDTVAQTSGIACTDVPFVLAEKISTPAALLKIVKEKIMSVERIDFTGDNAPDFICKTAVDSNFTGNEYWVSSDYTIAKKSTHFSASFHYR